MDQSVWATVAKLTFQFIFHFQFAQRQLTVAELDWPHHQFLDPFLLEFRTAFAFVEWLKWAKRDGEIKDSEASKSESKEISTLFDLFKKATLFENYSKCRIWTF